MSRFRAVFFDMDGVTVESAWAWRDFERSTLLDEVIESGEIDPEEVRALSIGDTFQRLSAADGVNLRLDQEGMYELYDRAAESIYREQASLMEGFDEIIQTIQSQALSIGLVSASQRRWVELALDRFALGETFDAVVAADDIDGPSKPAPGLYEKAADDVGVDPTEAIAIEDSEHGLEAAARAGMYVIGLRGRANGEADLSRADSVASDPRALHAQLRTLCGQA